MKIKYVFAASFEIEYCFDKHGHLNKIWSNQTVYNFHCCTAHAGGSVVGV